MSWEQSRAATPAPTATDLALRFVSPSGIYLPGDARRSEPVPGIRELPRIPPVDGVDLRARDHSAPSRRPLVADPATIMTLTPTQVSRVRPFACPKPDTRADDCWWPTVGGRASAGGGRCRKARRSSSGSRPMRPTRPGRAIAQDFDEAGFASPHRVVSATPGLTCPTLAGLEDRRAPGGAAEDRAPRAAVSGVSPGWAERREAPSRRAWEAGSMRHLDGSTKGSGQDEEPALRSGMSRTQSGSPRGSRGQSDRPKRHTPVASRRRAASRRCLRLLLDVDEPLESRGTARSGSRGRGR